MSQPSPSPGDMQSLRCLHCMKVIRCSRYDTSGLVRHIEQDHPEIYAATNDKIRNLHKLAADHGISEERLSRISKMTGLSESQMADKADKCCASCVVTCWPLCFLPCLLPSDNREYLYCPHCRTFLGIYDRDNNCVKPSKEFVSCATSATPPPKSPLIPPPQ
uniref:Uncharacterized protein LOC108037790 n=1 Tax=Drosophila rhopaloa TaxID=1041015 RepID=A0A6P4E3U5_DRORH